MSNVELIEELERWYQDGSDEWFQRIMKLCRGIAIEADQVETLKAEVVRLREENLDLMKEYVLDAFEQACTTKDGRYDHCCISVWENTQAVLLKHGLIKPEQCVRREDAV